MSILGLLIKSLGLGAYLIVAVTVLAVIAGFDVIWRSLVALSDIWLLQTLGAAWIALTFQKAQAASVRKLDELNRVHERRVLSTKSVLGLIDTRLHATRRYLAAIELEPEYIQHEREFYKQAVYEWNASIKTHQISLLVDYQDSYYGLELDHFFMPKFALLDRLLRQHRIEAQAGIAPSIERSNRINAIMADISATSLKIMRRMLLVAKRDREFLDSRAPLAKHNLHMISFGQLLSALFGRRQEP